MPSAGADAAVLVLGAQGGTPAELYPWLEAAAEARQVPAAIRHAMHVALEEAVMNVAMHGFAPGEHGDIRVSLRCVGETVALMVEDSGRAFDQATAPARPRAATLDTAAPGGLGLTLLRHYCRDVRYERAAGHNHLTLSFPLPPT